MDQSRLHSHRQDLDPSKRWVIGAAIFQSQPVSQEALEETSLAVSGVVGEIEPMTWESRSGVSNVQLNYVVTVRGDGVVRTNPKKHSDWRWVGEKEVGGFHMTSEMREVVRNAFRLVANSS